MSVLALVPSRSGSKGIPGKNFRKLGGRTLVQHAVDCAKAAGIRHVCVSTDNQALTADDVGADVLWRGPELAADDTPMLAVVQDFIARAGHLYTATLPAWTGKRAEQTLNDVVIVLLQPTQPMRTPEHVREAVKLLKESRADSVVSVVPLPLTHSPELACVMNGDELRGYDSERWVFLGSQPTRRQDAEQAYRRDGTVYAFWRANVEGFGNIYGKHVRPLLIDPADSCELDTEADWAAVEARWKARHG